MMRMIVGMMLVMSLWGSTGMAQTINYDMIAQRPDGVQAVQPAYSADFVACCSAFSASTVQIVFNGKHPIMYAQVMVHMLARTQEDSARIRAFQYQPDGSILNVYGPPMQPKLLNAPRTVGFWIPTDWINSVRGEWHFAIEFKGTPLIYGAKIIINYE